MAEFINQIEGEDYSLIFLDTLDLLTITVPPALPATLQVGLTIALHRLKKKHIFCIAPQKINSAGKVNLMCFDKTGTLTEEGLLMHKVKQVIDGEFSELDVDSSAPIFEVLACCHTLINLHGNLIGDYLDLQMFQSTSCKIRDHQDHTQVYLDQPLLLNAFNRFILKTFDFDPKLQRMGVVIKRNDS